MQKLQKKRNFQLRKNFKFKKKSRSKWFLRNILRKKPYRPNPFFFINKSRQALIINLTIRPNNVFCCLQKTNSKTLFKLNSGEAQIKITGRRLKRSFKFVLTKFFSKLSRYLNNGTRFIVRIVCPSRMKKHMLRFLSEIKHTHLKNLLAADVLSKKPYNGCRPAKMRRKKRKGMKIVK